MPSTLVVAGAAFLGGMATSSLDNSTKSRILADTKTGATLGSATLAARKTDTYRNDPTTVATAYAIATPPPPP